LNTQGLLSYWTD